MTDYAADQADTATNGIAATQRTGTASADTVGAGTMLLIQNTGAGSHNFDLGVNYSYDGLNPGSVATAPGNRRITIGAGLVQWGRIRADAGQAHGRGPATNDRT